MKKSKLILFAIFPAFALTSCGLKTYAESYKLITDNLNKAEEKTKGLDDNLGFKRTFSSSTSINSFVSKNYEATDTEGNTSTKVGKITTKTSLSFKDALFESTGAVLHGNITLDFKTFIKDTTEHSEPSEIMKANDSTLPETTPDAETEGETTPDTKPTEPEGGETTPDTKPTEPEGGETTPEPETPVEPEGGETTPEPETPVEPEESDFAKGVKKEGKLTLNAYLFDADSETFLTLEGSLEYKAGGINNTFKVYTPIPRISVNDIIDDYKAATSIYYNLLPVPPEKTDDEVAKASTPLEGYENILRYVSASSTDTEVNVKYQHSRTQKPLIPGNTDSTTSSLIIKIRDGLVSSCKTEFNSTINDLKNEAGKLNVQAKDKTSNKYEIIDKIETPTIADYQKTELVNAVDCKSIFTFFSLGTAALYRNI